MTKWEWRSFKDVVQRYFKFTQEELRGLIVSILILTFIVAYNDGSATFELTHWALNFLQGLLIMTATVLVMQAGHRLTGLVLGFRVEYKIWWNGLIIGLVAALLSRGKLWILAPGGIFLHHMAIHRLGWMRYGINVKALGLTALMGPVFNIIFGAIAKTIALWFPNAAFVPVLNKVFFINIIFAVYNLIPIPPLAGSRFLYYSRMFYAFIFGFIGSYILLAFLGVYSFIYSIIIGFIVYALFYIFYEYNVPHMLKP